MNKKILLISIVIALVFIFLALWQGSKNNSDLKVDEIDKITEEAPIEVSDEPKNETGKNTLEALMSRGENLECTVSYESTSIGNPKTEGTFFTSRDRLRGDFQVKDGDSTVVSSMIIKDQKMFSWTEIDGAKYGMQVDLESLNNISGKKPDTKEPVPLDQMVNYDCKRWNNIDSSVFEPPKDIVFTDFGQVMKAGMEFGTVYEEGGNGTASQCAMCKQLPEGEARKQCLASLACES